MTIANQITNKSSSQNERKFTIAWQITKHITIPGQKQMTIASARRITITSRATNIKQITITKQKANDNRKTNNKQITIAEWKIKQNLKTNKTTIDNQNETLSFGQAQTFYTLAATGDEGYFINFLEAFPLGTKSQLLTIILVCHKSLLFFSLASFP